ncbi:hypothetical protein Kompost2_00010 [Pseudomonas phage vB_PpuP-Kompost-2]
MSLHSNFQPRRPGLTDAKIAAAKSLRAVANGFKVAGDPYAMDSLVARLQRQRLRYSDTGDFTRCYRGGF